MNHLPLSRLIFPLDQVFEELNIVNFRQIHSNSNPLEQVLELETLMGELTKIFDGVPDELLFVHYMDNNPQINFKTIFEYRLAGSSWKSLAKHFQVNDSRLRIFWYSCVKELTPTLREYLCERKS